MKNLVKVKSVKMLVAQSCLTLCDPRDCNPPGSFVHGILQARILEGFHALLQRIFCNQGSNPGLPPCSQTLYQLSHKRSPQILECISYMHIPSPVDLPNPGIQPRSPALHVDSLPIELSGKPPKKHPGLANSDMCSETRVNLWP